MPEADVPVVIEEEAARRIANLQIQKEVEMMLDWVRANVPDLSGIRIVGHSPSVSKEAVLIWAHDAGTPWKSVPESPDYHFLTWRFNTFPHEVGRQVSMWTTHLPMPQTPCEGKTPASGRLGGSLVGRPREAGQTGDVGILG
jgi:hypothetical protein